jgi:hypothetical protein
MTMRKADGICACILLAFGVVVASDGWRLGAFGWGLAGPESGLYPFLLGSGVCLGSLLVLARVFLESRRGLPNEPFIRKGGLKPILWVAVPAALMVLLTEFIGLFQAAGLYLAVYTRLVGRSRWVTVLAVSILLPLVSYIVFYKWFQIPLPMGRLEAHWPF